MGTPEEKKKEEEALREELTLLGSMMKLHEWTRFGQNEAQEEEEIETKLDSEASGSKTERSENEEKP